MTKDFRDEMVVGVDSEHCPRAKRLDITDELSISIQANQGAYCLPRTNLPSYKDYHEFELGFPNFVPPAYIMQYAEDSSCPENTVYGYVPYDLIQKMIDELRGGETK
jgi:hypothetical protein